MGGPPLSTPSSTHTSPLWARSEERRRAASSRSPTAPPTPSASRAPRTGATCSFLPTSPPTPAEDPLAVLILADVTKFKFSWVRTTEPLALFILEDAWKFSEVQPCTPTLAYLT